MDEAKRVDRVLDLNGLLCPNPSLITQKRLSDMGKGEMLEVICSDRAAKEAIVALCRKRKYELVGTTSEKGLIRFMIRK
ncbi:MAG: sulfurtransferase TusA family protein [Desulfobulbales bacterium]|nr:sulfurtransferase TusA family protein [Desulfobulbales bacterium]